MKKLVPLCYVLLTLAGLAGGIVCGIQFVMAIRFMELGRVVVYFTLAVLSLELFVIALTRLVRMRQQKKEQS